MSSDAQFESFTGGPQGGEKATESQEEFSERYRQTQAAIAQIQQEESHQQEHDDDLAVVIVQFLGAKDRTAFFLLLSRLFGYNIPSDFLLAILSLIYDPAHHAVRKYDGITQDMLPTTSFFLPQEKQQIDLWTGKIFAVAQKYRIQLQSTAFQNNSIHPDIIQLFVLVLREFLENIRHEEISLDPLGIFARSFFETVFQGKVLSEGTENNAHALSSENS